MKFLCTILSIYVLLVSTVACKDGVVLEKSKTQVVVTQDTNHAETPSDLCSPFCTCTCCVGITQPQLSENQVILSGVELIYPYAHRNILKNPHDLFQPPRA